MLRLLIKPRKEKLVVLPQDLLDLIDHTDTGPDVDAPDQGGLDGIYECASCHLPLFDSRHGCESRSGKSAFWQPIHPTCISIFDNEIFGIDRTAVECARCGAHLGYVFKDGPLPTGLRYSLTGDSLNFI